MNRKARVLVASRHKPAVDALVKLVDEVEGVETFVRHVSNGHADPLHGLEQAPDVLILRLGESWRLELDALEKRSAVRGPRVLIVAPSDEPEIMRRAMRAGARDFLFEPVNASELAQALSRALKDYGDATPGGESQLFAFINAKGGSGATTLACNVAHLMAIDEFATALVDLDLQFGTLPAYLDLQPKHDLLGALRPGGELDAIALNAYVAAHPSGLKVLGSRAQGMAIGGEIDDDRLEVLLDLLQSGYERVVVDLPRQLDSVMASVAGRADRIVVVAQQSFTNLRDAARLLGVLRKDLAIPEERLLLVVNRYDKKSPVGLTDIRNALHVDEPVLIPNDFRNVTSSINAGTPLYELARAAPVTKALKSLQTQLGGRDTRGRQGVLARTFSAILRT
jgi:pilus assembly protein CpaE